jgi:hypothetical protein
MILKSKIFITIQYLIFIGASIFLLKYCIAKIDFNTFYQTLSKGNYWVAIGVFVFSVLSYISRIFRWQIILQKVNETPSFINNFSAVALGYLVSFIFPRGGEVVKCMVLNRTDNLTINKSVSSTFFERIVDSLCLLTLIAAVLLMEVLTQNKLIINMIEPSRYFTNFKLWWLIAIGILMLVLVYKFYHKIKNKWLVNFINNLKQMVGLITHYKFTLHTIFIWLSYYLMTYLWFFVFVPTSNLSLVQAFQIMMLGTVARSLPLPGGAVGAYHITVAYGLHSMNIDNETALSLAFIIHGFQTLFTILAGTVAIVWLFVIRKNYRIK